MSHYAFYDSNGRIRMVARLSTIDVETNKLPNESVLKLDNTADPALFYVSDGEISQREPMPELSTSQSGNIVTVSNVPENCRVMWPDGEITVESGGFTFECNVTGALKFIFDPVQYKVSKRVIHVA